MAQNEGGTPDWIKNLSDEERRNALRKAEEALAQETEGITEQPTVNRRTILKAAAALVPLAFLGFKEVGKAGESDTKGERTSSPSRQQKKPEAKAVEPVKKQVSTQQQELPKPEKWVPRENAKFDDNGLVRIEPSPVKPGILDLSFKDPKTGKWMLYNNLVPAALVPGQDKPTNAEIDRATPIRIVTVNKQGEKELRYRYKLSNGARFDLMVQFDMGKKAVTVTTTKNADSAPISEYYLGNFWGLQTGVKTIVVNGKQIPAGSHGMPQDGYGRTGNFVFNLPGSNAIELLGKGVKQKQRLISAGNSRFDVTKEDRLTPWEKSQQQLYDANVGSGPWTEMAGYKIYNLNSSTVEFSVN